jgi:hypothetical protein
MGSLELRASICLEMTRKVLGKGAKFGLAGGGALLSINPERYVGGTYRHVQARTGKYRQIQASTGKYRQIQAQREERITGRIPSR